MDDPNIWKDILAMYVISLVVIAGFGLVAWAYVGAMGSLSDRAETELVKGYRLWWVPLISLSAGIGFLIYWITKDVQPPDKRFEALAIGSLSLIVMSAVLSISGYLMLWPLNLRGLGQKLGALMGMMFGVEAGRQLISYLGISLR